MAREPETTARDPEYTRDEMREACRVNYMAALEVAALECLAQLLEPAGEFEAGHRRACEENAHNIRALKGKV